MLLTVTARMAAIFKRPVNSQIVHQSRASSSADALLLRQHWRTHHAATHLTYSILTAGLRTAG